MRLLLFAMLLLAPASAVWPQPLGPIWQRGRDAVIVTTCPKGRYDDDDGSCRGVAIRRGDTVTPLGAGYQRVEILWSRKPDVRGPDVLVHGDGGGSGGNGDLFAIALAPRLVVRKLSGDRYDEITARTTHGALRMDLPFDIEFFNGAPRAGAVTVSIPMRWVGTDFAVDFAALRQPLPSERELAFRDLAISDELSRWAGDADPADRLYPPESSSGTPIVLTALADLMLSGHADAARALLHRTWPRRRGRAETMGGEADFWHGLCVTVVRHPLWRQYRLDRLPHADLIVSGAR